MLKCHKEKGETFMYKIDLISSSSTHLDEIETIYTEAFPENERMPFQRMMQLCQDELYAMFSLISENMCCGFSFIMRHQDMIYLFYLAVRKDQRGKGIGSILLNDLFFRYPDHWLCADIEAPQPQADNQEQRRQFYLDRGFSDSGYRNRWYGVDYDILTAQKPFKLPVYQSAVDLLQTARYPAHIFKRNEGRSDE